MQEAAHLDVFGIVVDDDRGLEDALSQVALVLTGEINAPFHLHQITRPHAPALIPHSCLLSDTLEVYHQQTILHSGLFKTLWRCLWIPQKQQLPQRSCKRGWNKELIARTTTVMTRLNHRLKPRNPVYLALRLLSIQKRKAQSLL